MTDYREFLERKVAVAPSYGETVSAAVFNPILKPHQRAIAQWMVDGGRRACFAAFGLGKSVIQLEVVRVCREREGGMGLIVIPLGVRQEFVRDARMLGIPVKFIRRIEEATDPAGIYLTNYETVRDRKLDPRLFSVTSLDEAAVLRGFGGTKTFREFMALFAGDDRQAGVRTEGIRYRFVATATPSPNEYIELLAYAAFLGIMDVGQAKAQPLDAKVLTPSGWTTMGELQVGDHVIAGDGSPTKVLGVYPQGDRPIYRVTFDDGSSTECDADHLWLTTTQYERNNGRRYLQRNPEGDRAYARVKTTAEIAETLRHGHQIPLVEPVQLESRPVPVDPWLLGFLIGDGTLRDTNVVVSSVDEELLERVRRALPVGLRLRRTASGACDYSVTSTGRKGGRGPGSNPLLNALRVLDLTGKRAWEKRVPTVYLCNEASVRLAVLQGLMDADGTVHTDGTQVRFASSSAGLADDVRSLVQSLGGTASIRRRSTKRRDAYLVLIRLPNGVSPFTLTRKADRVFDRAKYLPTRMITAVGLVGTKPAQCIAVEHPDHLYVTDEYVVTHNTRFFRRNSEKADKLTLHPHKEEEFWLWVASWAMFLQKPSDLGPEYSDDGYTLPPLDVRWHLIPTDHSKAGADRDGQGRLFRSTAIGVQDAAREKRDSLNARVEKLLEIRAEDPGAHRLLWHDLEDERRALEKAIPGLVTVYGSQDLEEREARVIAFSDGEIPELASKPVLLGSGCNFQRHCAWAIFIGIGFKFADFVQAVHRIQRFLQPHPVRIDLIYTEAEQEVRQQLERKWRQHEEMVQRMTEIIQEYGLAQVSMAHQLARSMGVDRVEAKGELYTCVNNDCVEETRGMPADSVDLIVTSIPFATQYEYTPSYNDFGHTDTNEHFWAQMDYLTPELHRVLAPGRVAAIHVKDRIMPGGINGLGFQTVNPFSDECVAHFQKHGFAFLARKTIVTDVVRENNQTYRLGWTEQCKDGSRMGAGMPEYLLIFRKPPTDRSNGYADQPVVKSKAAYTRPRWQFDAHGFARSNGNRPLQPEELEGLTHAEIFQLFKRHSLQNTYDFRHDVRIAEHVEKQGWLPSTFMLLQPQSWHPDVWADVVRMRSLNTLQGTSGREQHLCPLPFDIVERAIEQYSMPGELVFDPFMGIGTVPYMAIKMGRRGLGVELNPAYFLDGAAYCAAAERELTMPTLFDLGAAELEETA
jgi:DNA modification methylase